MKNSKAFVSVRSSIKISVQQWRNLNLMSNVTQKCNRYL